MTIEELRCQFKISLCAGKINNNPVFARLLRPNLVRQSRVRDDFSARIQTNEQ